MCPRAVSGNLIAPPPMPPPPAAPTLSVAAITPIEAPWAYLVLDASETDAIDTIQDLDRLAVLTWGNVANEMAQWDSVSRQAVAGQACASAPQQASSITLPIQRAPSYEIETVTNGLPYIRFERSLSQRLTLGPRAGLGFGFRRRFCGAAPGVVGTYPGLPGATITLVARFRPLPFEDDAGDNVRQTLFEFHYGAGVVRLER